MFACGHLVGRDDEQTLLGIEGGLDVLATGRYLAEAHLIALDARHLQTTYLLTRLLATDAFCLSFFSTPRSRMLAV